MAFLYRFSDHKTNITIFPFENFNGNLPISKDKLTQENYIYSYAKLMAKIFKADFEDVLTSKDGIKRTFLGIFNQRLPQYLVFAVESSKSQEYAETEIKNYIDHIIEKYENISKDEFNIFKRKLISEIIDEIANFDGFCSYLVYQLECKRIDLLENQKFCQIIEWITKDNIFFVNLFRELVKISSD